VSNQWGSSIHPKRFRKASSKYGIFGFHHSGYAILAGDGGKFHPLNRGAEWLSFPFCDAALPICAASTHTIAHLKGKDMDWTNGTVSFRRQKTRVPMIVRLSTETLNLLKDLPAQGVLFPYLSSVRANERATEFRSSCRQLGIDGAMFHSYRYAWAERAKVAGYLEGFAQETLGHNSKAVHRAYAKRALINIPSLEQY
jgi:hypothetical protein